jgi:hypothetical protein
MPLCEGLPDGPCPQNTNSRSVKLTQGDLMLCPKCDVIRFPPPLVNNDSALSSKNDTSVTSKNVKAKPKKSSCTVTSGSTTGINSTQSNSNQSQCVPDNEQIHQLDKQQPSCASVPTTTPTFVASTDDSTGSQLASLRVEVQRQQNTITKLQTQLNFVMSFLGVIEPDIESINNCSGIPTNVDSHATNQKLWSTVAANKKTQKCRNDFQQSLIAAVYNDQTESRRRESSFIITGCDEDQHYPDSEQVRDLCRDELNMQPSIVSTKRLGQVQPNRARPLLVFTSTVDQAQRLITEAKKLRQSSRSSVRSNVYISRNLTRAEAEAAYQSRVRRRQAATHTNKISALPQDRAGVNGSILQPTLTTNIDASSSLSLLTIASNPYVIIPPPPVSQFQQQSTGLILPPFPDIEEKRTGRQATQT